MGVREGSPHPPLDFEEPAQVCPWGPQPVTDDLLHDRRAQTQNPPVQASAHSPTPTPGHPHTCPQGMTGGWRKQARPASTSPLAYFMSAGSTDTEQRSHVERTGQAVLPGYRGSMVTGPHPHTWLGSNSTGFLLGTFKRGSRERRLKGVSVSWQESTCPFHLQEERLRGRSPVPSRTFGPSLWPENQEQAWHLLGLPLAGRCEKRALVQAPARWLGLPRTVRSQRCRVPEPGAASERQRSRALPGAGRRGGDSDGALDSWRSVPPPRQDHGTQVSCLAQTCPPQEPGHTGCLCGWDTKTMAGRGRDGGWHKRVRGAPRARHQMPGDRSWVD